jgi:glycosyltransferase involved in cell wall biosynthesis
VKVAFVNQPLDSILPPYQSSIGIWTYRVAPFVAEKMRVKVYGRRTAIQNHWDQQGNIEYRFYPIFPSRLTRILRWIYQFDEGGKLPDYATRPYYAEFILPVSRSIRKNQFEVVHIHNFTQFVPFVQRISPKSKICLHMNCEWLSQLDYQLMDKRIHQTDLVLGSSNHITDLVKERFPHHADRCFTLYNGVDATLFTPRKSNIEQNGKAPKILFVGRVSPEKGIHDLISAFLKVVIQFPNAKLDIVGPIGILPVRFLVGISDDPVVSSLTEWYRADYYWLLNELIPEKHRQNIEFHGGVSQSELVAFYREADILVNPSYSESFGMSLVEAMACEKPVVACRAGGMVEIVDGGKFGTLVERGDVDGLTAGILDLISDPEKRIRLGKKGRERVLEYFDWPQIAQKAISYYES